MDNDLYALLFWLIIGEASWQKMTQEEGALLSTKSEFDVEFDRVNCRIEDVDSVVCFSAISLNSYGRPVNWATFTEAGLLHSDAVVLRQKT